MAILINLNDARKKLNELEGSAEYNKGVTDAFNTLFDLPTIKAEEIFYDGYAYCLMDFGRDTVLCRECKHHEDEEPGMVYCPKIVGGWVSNTFYCGYAERKESEE